MWDLLCHSLSPTNISILFCGCPGRAWFSFFTWSRDTVVVPILSQWAQIWFISNENTSKHLGINVGRVWLKNWTASAPQSLFSEWSWLKFYNVIWNCSFGCVKTSGHMWGEIDKRRLGSKMVFGIGVDDLLDHSPAVLSGRCSALPVNVVAGLDLVSKSSSCYLLPVIFQPYAKVPHTHNYLLSCDCRTRQKTAKSGRMLWKWTFVFKFSPMQRNICLNKLYHTHIWT